jgi:predicted sulfurtransferase
MKSPRLPTGTSDPVSFTCTCPASSPSSTGGLVLLFYRYFTANPPLPASYQALANNSTSLAEFHTQLTQKHNLGGKIRIAKEGFNITVGGTKSEIEAYIRACLTHWSFSGLDLCSPTQQREFFKPTSGGCACVFDGAPASVRVTAEITPMGVTDYIPRHWDGIESLSPEDFHESCYREQEMVLLDVRNHYESRIGYFVDPRTGEPAIRPGIRRFSQWPMYVRRYMMGGSESLKGGEGGEGCLPRQIMTYCTGGIRCEKGVRWMAENMERREGDRVCTLKGGIAAYLTWMDEEIRQGRKTVDESLFRGKNYVFDARGSTGLRADETGEPVSTCHICANPSDRLSKCRSKGCHLILVICETCEEEKEPRCCQDCHDLDSLDTAERLPGPRPICKCEKEREALLWGGERVKLPKTQGWKKGRNTGKPDVDAIGIQVKTID